MPVMAPIDNLIEDMNVGEKEKCFNKGDRKKKRLIKNQGNEERLQP
jgi:hypothetical protein